MNARTAAFLALVVGACVISACHTRPARPCNGYYHDVRELGFCDLGPNTARKLDWTW